MAVTFTAHSLPTILTKAICLYQPSCYNGTGLEVRRNLVLVVADTITSTGCADRGRTGARADPHKHPEIRRTSVQNRYGTDWILCGRPLENPSP